MPKTLNQHKSHRIYDWRVKHGIIGDYDKIFEILRTTGNCDYCDVEMYPIGTKSNKHTKVLDHCSSCGTVRGILCNSCNLKNKLRCYLCD